MLIDAVANAIETYISGHKNRNLRTLERKSGVSYSTIRRIMQKEVAAPSIETTIIPILSIFMTQDEVYRLISQHDEKWGEYWKPLSDKKYEYKELDDVSLVDIDQLIILESRKEGGTNAEEIEKAYGQKLGAQRLAYLLDKGLLKRVEGVVLPAHDFEQIKSPQKTLESIETSARNFDASHVGKGAYYHHFSGSMSKHDYDTVKHAAAKYVETVHNTISNPTPGDEMMVMLNIFGDFLGEGEK